MPEKVLPDLQIKDDDASSGTIDWFLMLATYSEQEPDCILPDVEMAMS